MMSKEIYNKYERCWEDLLREWFEKINGSRLFVGRFHFDLVRWGWLILPRMINGNLLAESTLYQPDICKQWYFHYLMRNCSLWFSGLGRTTDQLVVTIIYNRFRSIWTIAKIIKHGKSNFHAGSLLMHIALSPVACLPANKLQVFCRPISYHGMKTNYSLRVNSLINARLQNIVPYT